MKKLYIAIAFGIVMMFPLATQAVGQGNNPELYKGAEVETSIVPTSPPSENSNEVQNMGEDDQIRTREMEQKQNEGTEGG